jgi:hypothetical protein
MGCFEPLVFVSPNTPGGIIIDVGRLLAISIISGIKNQIFFFS